MVCRHGKESMSASARTFHVREAQLAAPLINTLLQRCSRRLESGETDSPVSAKSGNPLKRFPIPRRRWAPRFSGVWSLDTFESAGLLDGLQRRVVLLAHSANSGTGLNGLEREGGLCKVRRTSPRQPIGAVSITALLPRMSKLQAPLKRCVESWFSKGRTTCDISGRARGLPASTVAHDNFRVTARNRATVRPVVHPPRRVVRSD